MRRMLLAVAVCAACLVGCGFAGDPAEAPEEPASAATGASDEKTTDAQADESIEESVDDPAKEVPMNGNTTREETRILGIQVGETMLTAELEDNSSAAALADLLAEGPITVNLHDYGSFEKVGPLPQSLPTNDAQITTSPGDVILYQGDQISIYYDVNSWSFTRLAHIEGATTESLLSVLGEDDVEVVLSLAG